MFSLWKYPKFLLAFILMTVSILSIHVLPASAGLNQWTKVSETQDITVLAFSPYFQVDQTIFAGTRSGGVIKSIDGGQNWSPTSGGVPINAVSGLVISPNYKFDKTVFAATLFNGIFKTTNDGDTWTPVNTGLNENFILSLAISPDFAVDNTLFAGTSTDVFRSVNRGDNWTALTGTISNSPLSIAISPDYGNDHTVFVGAGLSDVYKSTNNGDSWTKMSADLFVVQDLVLSPDYANDKTVFAGTEFGVFKSTNGGVDWIEANSGLGVEGRGFPKYIMDLEISPNFATDRTIFAANYGVFKSNNGGLTWTPLNSGFPASSYAVETLALPPDFVNGRTVFSTIQSDQTNRAYRYTFSPLTSTVVWDSGAGNWEWSAGKTAAGDFNGDGLDDIAVLYGYASERQTVAWVFTGNGSGFNAPQSWWASGPGNWDWAGSTLESGDFNGDGLDDLAVLYGYAAERDVKAFVFPSNGNRFTGTEEWWHAGPGNWDISGALLTGGNFNGDGLDDLAVLYGYAAERDVKAFVFPSNGNRFTGTEEWWHAGPGNWDFGENLLSSGDFNGDGISDLLATYRYFNFPYSIYGENINAYVFPSTGLGFPAVEEWWKSYYTDFVPWSAHTKILTGGFENFASPGDDFAVLTNSPEGTSWLFGLPSQSTYIIDPFIDPVPSAPGSVFAGLEQTWWAAAPEDWNWMSAKPVSGDFDGNGLDEFAVLYDYGGSRSGLIVIR